MLIFYATPVSSYSAKLRIALAAKGITCEEREPPGGYRSQDWRVIQPTGTIPAIDDAGFVLAESEAIIEYLEDRHLEPPLLPGSAQDRARSRFLARFHDLQFEPSVRALFPLVNPTRRDAARLTEVATALNERIALLNRIATPAPWMAGREFSTADCGFAVSLPLARLLLEAMGRVLALPAAIECWLAVAQAHPAVIAGLAPWRPATEHWISAQLAPA